MRIEHVGLWTNQLETLRDFYVEHFGCTTGARYHNPATGFSSYFLTFSSGARLELMTKAGLGESTGASIGYAHLALSLGSEEQVRALTETFRARGVRVTSEPRRTGDGYFESVVADPDGNLIELTA